MNKTSLQRFKPSNVLHELLGKLTLAVISLTPCVAWADGGGGSDPLGGAGGKVETFLTNLTTVLNMASIGVVTVAVVFAGYQIAFAHKRISDVAPILIGGLLIGAATQIAKMVIGEPEAGISMVVSALASYA